MKKCACVFLIVGAVLAVAGAIFVGIIPATAAAGERTFVMQPLGRLLVDLGLIAVILSGAALAGLTIVEAVHEKKK